jgi:hypothetical protein
LLPGVAEQILHPSLHVIPLNRISDFTADGNGEPAVGEIVFQKVQKKNRFESFWPIAAWSQNRFHF